MTSTPQAATDAPALLRGLFDDAIDMAVRGFASAADIDTAMRLGAGHPAGPFELRALHVESWRRRRNGSTTSPQTSALRRRLPSHAHRRKPVSAGCCLTEELETGSGGRERRFSGRV
jgi:3-hydroxybutyryl-CoA dehydrogenase